jgi:hypothetical protein
VTALDGGLAVSPPQPAKAGVSDESPGITTTASPVRSDGDAKPKRDAERPAKGRTFEEIMMSQVTAVIACLLHHLV